MKICRYVFAAALVLAASSCADKVRIDGALTGAADAEVVVKHLAGSKMEVLDTVMTDAAGRYSYKMAVPKGQPEFVYLFKGDTKVASLLLENGDKVKVISDTLGMSCTVEGSEQCVKLLQVEKEFSDFLARMGAAAEAGDNAELSREYLAYYRSRVKFVLENTKSLVSVPVLYQKVNADFPVFNQITDALSFKSIYDSLMTVYPDSKIVAALGDDVKRKMNLLDLNLKMRNVEEQGFPPLELPSADGSIKSLAQVDAKVVLVYFWSATDAAQKMYNQDVLIPVYNEYHSKGFEIFAVSLDVEKGTWASAVKHQNLPWINVCDGNGYASKAATSYNVGPVLPVAYVLVDGVLTQDLVQNEDDLRKILKANLN